MPSKPKQTYVKPNGRPQLFTYHAPSDIYEYLMKVMKERGVPRNRALTEIIEEHRDKP